MRSALRVGPKSRVSMGGKSVAVTCLPLRTESPWAGSTSRVPSRATGKMRTCSESAR
jgi:hypothetical protein